MYRSLYQVKFALLLLLPLGIISIACTKNLNLTAPTPAAPPEIPALQIVTTLAGQAGVTGYANGPGATALFYVPTGVAVDFSGNVYVADHFNHVVRKITPGGIVSTLAGSGVFGYADGTGTAASFSSLTGVAVDALGNVYVADFCIDVIRKITPGGVVTTLAGSAGVTGCSNGMGTAASFNHPEGVAVDSSGTVYVADTENQLIRKISPGGVVTTLAGSAGVTGATNGTGTSATFSYPAGVAVDFSGTVYVADNMNPLIRKISPGGVVTTLAGSAGVTGATNGTGTSATFSYPDGVSVDIFGNVYVTDSWNQLIRKITPGGVVSTLAGSGAYGSTNGSLTSSSFAYPSGLAVDTSGHVYVADMQNNLIRKIQ